MLARGAAAPSVSCASSPFLISFEAPLGLLLSVLTAGPACVQQQEQAIQSSDHKHRSFGM